jgi:hypothetical protein
MKDKSTPKQLSFQSKLERISDELEYFALPVPAKITQALGTKGPVPVMARVNDSKAFLISLYPVGGGRHSIRVKAEIRKATQIKEGDRVKVQITVRDRTTEISIPKDLMSVLKAERVVEDFEALPIGKKSFILRRIEDAAKPETREKRIQEALEAAHGKREKRS